MERREPAAFDAARDAGFEREVVVEEAEDVGVVRAVRRGGEAEEEAAVQCGQHAAPRGRGGVVDFVEDDVVVARGSQQLAVTRLRELGDGGEDEIRVQLVPVVHAEADAREVAVLREHCAEGASGLAQQLATVGDEEEAQRAAAFLLQTREVEGGEQGLAEAGGEHHQRTRAAFGAGSGEGGQCGQLHLVGFEWLARWRGGFPCRYRRRYTCRPRGVVREPGVIRRAGLAPLRVEGFAYAMIGMWVSIAVNAQVPLYAGAEGCGGEVAAAYPGVGVGGLVFVVMVVGG